MKIVPDLIDTVGADGLTLLTATTIGKLSARMQHARRTHGTEDLALEVVIADDDVTLVLRAYRGDALVHEESLPMGPIAKLPWLAQRVLRQLHLAETMLRARAFLAHVNTELEGFARDDAALEGGAEPGENLDPDAPISEPPDLAEAIEALADELHDDLCFSLDPVLRGDPTVSAALARERCVTDARGRLAQSLARARGLGAEALRRAEEQAWVSYLGGVRAFVAMCARNEVERDDAPERAEEVTEALMGAVEEVREPLREALRLVRERVEALAAREERHDEASPQGTFVAFRDARGRAWGFREGAAPPLHVENLERGDGEARVRVELEERGVRVLRVTEGALEAHEHAAIAAELRFRFELEEAWAKACVRRGLVTARREGDVIVLSAYAGTPHAYEVYWRLTELTGRHTRRDQDKAPWEVRCDAREGLVVVDRPPFTGDDAHPFEPAELLFSHVAPAELEAVGGRDLLEVRRFRELDIRQAQASLRVTLPRLFEAAALARWEELRTGEAVHFETEDARRHAIGRAVDLWRSGLTPQGLAELLAQVARRLDTARLVRNARVAYAAATGDAGAPRGFEREATRAGHQEVQEVIEVLTRRYDDTPTAVDACRLTSLPLERVVPEIKGHARAKLFVSAGDFLEGTEDAARGPRVIVALPRGEDEALSEEAQVTIESPPRVFGALGDPTCARVVAFVEANREALLRHWRLETDTPTLCEELVFPEAGTVERGPTR